MQAEGTSIFTTWELSYLRVTVHTVEIEVLFLNSMISNKNKS